MLPLSRVVMSLPARFPDVWASLAVPLSEFLHEVAEIDAEINNANRLKLGPWIDKVETIARPGVGDIDTHKLVGLHTRIPPWDHDEHRSGELLWPPSPPQLDMLALVPAAFAAALRGEGQGGSGFGRSPRRA